VDGLCRHDLSQQLGATEPTLLNWELGHTKEIPERYVPRVLEYLGYDPERPPLQFGARLKWKRRRLGWTIKEAAERNTVDPSSWATWECMDGPPRYPRYRQLLEDFLELPCNVLQDITRQPLPAPPSRGKKRNEFS
jgi:hypothetical protein